MMMFTSRPGTATTLRTCLPATSARTGSAAITAASSPAASRSGATCNFAFGLPPIYTSTSTVSCAGPAEPGTRQVVHSIPPIDGLNHRCGPSSPQRAQCSNDGA